MSEYPKEVTVTRTLKLPEPGVPCATEEEFQALKELYKTRPQAVLFRGKDLKTIYARLSFDGIMGDYSLAVPPKPEPVEYGHTGSVIEKHYNLDVYDGWESFVLEISHGPNARSCVCVDESTFDAVDIGSSIHVSTKVQALHKSTNKGNVPPA